MFQIACGAPKVRQRPCKVELLGDLLDVPCVQPMMVVWVWVTCSSLATVTYSCDGRFAVVTELHSRCACAGDESDLAGETCQAQHFRELVLVVTGSPLAYAAGVRGWWSGPRSGCQELGVAGMWPRSDSGDAGAIACGGSVGFRMGQIGMWIRCQFSLAWADAAFLGRPPRFSTPVEGAVLVPAEAVISCSASP